jgi:3',5'-cyclic AMP phosphodiesterase CpdA
VKKLAHVSDLHFGREDPLVAEALVAELATFRPDLVVVSGDLTQRARRKEFAKAVAFLARLPQPQLVVPGNHDIPLFDVVRRFASPLGRYRRYLHADRFPAFDDGELSVLGMCTARRYLWKDGSVDPSQLEAIRQAFAGKRDRALRVLVTHHPLVPRPGADHPAIVTRGHQATAAAAGAGVDLLLAGHLHLGSVSDLRTAHEGGHDVIVAQAGTAVSVRRRHEPNSYNFLTLDGDRLTIAVRAWDGARFTRREEAAFARGADGWRRLEASPQPATGVQSSTRLDPQ